MMTAHCPWYVAGPLLGLLIVSLRAAVNKPLSRWPAMIGEGQLGGLAVAAGLLAGVALQPTLAGTSAVERQPTAAPQPVGL